MAGDIDKTLTELAARQHGVVTRAEARHAGLNDRAIEWRVATGRWLVAQRGVYTIAGAPETYEQRLLAAVLAAGKVAVASHRSAARVEHIPGFERATVEVTVLHPRRRAKPIAGGKRHYSTLLPDAHRKTVDAIPTTTVARTLFDLCAVVHPGRAERAVDNCLSRRWVTVPALWKVLDDLAIQGRNGTCALREILSERGEGYVAPASDLERIFLGLLARSGLPVPVRELDLGDTDQWTGRVEFVYREQSVLVEIDSRLHHTAMLDFERDRERDNAFVAQGWRVLRFTYAMLVDTPSMVERTIRRALRPAA
jgi:hypothetical protein